MLLQTTHALLSSTLSRATILEEGTILLPILLGPFLCWRSPPPLNVHYLWHDSCIAFVIILDLSVLETIILISCPPLLIFNVVAYQKKISCPPLEFSSHFKNDREIVNDDR